LGELIIDLLGLEKGMKVCCHQFGHEVSFFQMLVIFRILGSLGECIHVFGRGDEDIVELDKIFMLELFQ
jgi:hypothetical protein